MAVYFLIGIGGMVGALLRYGLAVLTDQSGESTFPISTLLANYIGCFLLPFFIGRLNGRFPLHIQKAVTTGVIGSFTTFSAFSVETALLIQTGQVLKAGLYVFLSIAGGLFFVYLGAKRGRTS